MKTLDTIDQGILTILQEDAKSTHKEIAARLGLSTTPIYERVKRLEKEGYIKGYVALVDPKKLGRKLLVFASVSLREHAYENLQAFVKQVNSFPEVMECFHVTGAYDYLLKVLVADIEAYQDFVINGLSTAGNIAHVQSSFVMGEVKHATALPM
jgi:Lrp/AsnC family leucine-responsive transcriptional regulator